MGSCSSFGSLHRFNFRMLSQLKTPKPSWSPPPLVQAVVSAVCPKCSVCAVFPLSGFRGCSHLQSHCPGEGPKGGVHVLRGLG